jgi:flagellar M-ring protein FliF
MTSDQRSKETSAVGEPAGVPGTQSNLPRATPRPSTNTQVTRETSNTSFQSTRTIRRTKMPQGTLKRLSVSVLIDETATWQGRGANLRRVVTPPTQQTMDRITGLVSAAVGIRPERGDRIVVESLPFETTREEPPPASLQQQTPGEEHLLSVRNIMTGLMLLAIAAAVFGVVRSQKNIRAGDAASPQLVLQASTEAAHAALPEQTATPLLSRQMEHQRLKEREHAEMLEATGAALKNLIESAVTMSQTNSELCAGVLRGWLHEKEGSVSE